MDDMKEQQHNDPVGLTIRSEPFNIGELIDDVVGTFKPLAEEKGVPLSLTFLTRMPGSVMLDARRVRQVIAHLVENAIENAESEGAQVRTSYSEEVDQVYIEIEDDGPGIPSDQLDKVFEPREQDDSVEGQNETGDGFCLADTRSIARNMNGDITVYSSEGEGSLFRITLPSIYMPLAKTASKSSESPVQSSSESTSDLSGLTVLVVDDQKVNRDLLKHILERHDVKTVLASNGEAALEAFGQTGVDTIVLDVMMPGMNGYETARRLRRLPGGDRVPILMLSAHDQESERAKAFDAGANEYLTKPFNAQELCSIIARLSRRQSSTTVGESNELDALSKSIAKEFLEHNEQRANEILANVNDTDAVAEWLHMISGTAGSLGYPDLTHLARTAEKSLAEHQPKEEITERISRLRSEIRHTLKTEFK